MHREAIITSEELIDLAENLKDLGFILDVNQYLSAHRVEDILLALELDGEAITPERLRNILAPIFCSTPDEQETFYGYFADWLSRRPQIADRLQELQQAQSYEKSPPENIRMEKTPIPAWLPIVMLFLILAGAAYYFLPWETSPPVQPELLPPTEVNLSGVVRDGSDKSTVTNARVIILSDTVTTDTSGQFTLRNLPVDTRVDLQIHHPQYLHKRISQSIGQRDDTLTFTIWQKSTEEKYLSGRVIDNNTGRAIFGAEVFFLSDILSTDSSGYFIFPYTPIDNRAILRTIHPEYIADSRQIPLHGHIRPDMEVLLQEKPPAETDSLNALVDRINAFADSLEKKNSYSATEAFYHRNYEKIRYSGFALPFILFLVWIFSRWYRRRIFLERRSASQPRDMQTVVVKGLADYLFRNSPFRRLVQQYRRHLEVTSPELDVPATVEATVDRGGLFTPVFAARYISPEYLVLIDRTSFGDQYARLIDQVINRMASDGVIIDRYYFEGDPQVCQPENPHAAHLTIQELFARHPAHRLLIFTAAVNFIDPRSGRPQHWLERLLEWPSCAIFIPENTEGVEYLAETLRKLGFNVGQVSTTGIGHYIDILQENAKRENSHWSANQYYPTLLEERPNIWLENHPPEERWLEELFQQLSDFLDSDTLYWLRACAVYPELHWELTLYLATKITLKDQQVLPDKAQLQLQQRLFQLTRLPWFREGIIPDWLRLQLIAGMDNRQHREVRAILKELLGTARPEADSPKTKEQEVELAHAPGDYRDQIQQLREIVLGKLGITGNKDPLKDYVFSNYMSGGNPSRLSVLVPDAVKRLFFRKGQTVLGLRPLAAFLTAIFVGTSLWNLATMFKPQLPAIPPIPRFTVTENANIAGIAGLVGESQQTIANYLDEFFAFQQTPPVADSSVAYRANYFRFQQWLSDTLQQSVGFNNAQYSFYTRTISDSDSTLMPWQNGSIYLILNDSLASLDNLFSIDNSDTLTITEKLARFQNYLTNRRESIWERNYAQAKIDSLRNIINNSATIAKPEDFLTSQQISNGRATEVGNSFNSGQIFAWGNISSPVAEDVTFHWYANGQEIDRETTSIGGDQSLWDSLTYMENQVGVNEVRLYNEGNHLIGRRVFTITSIASIDSSRILDSIDVVRLDTTDFGGFVATDSIADDGIINFGDYYALLIAVEDYLDVTISDLRFPIEDAEALKQVLTKYYNFHQENVILLKNPDRRSIFESFFNLRRKITPNDNLLIFYAGHGYWNEDLLQGYWLSAKAKRDNASEWISNSDVQDLIRGIQTKHTLLISDASFSGSLFRLRSVNVITENSQNNILELYKHTSRKAITSGYLTEVPDKSVFVDYLIKELEGNSAKYISALSLFHSLLQPVINNSPTMQAPQYGTIQQTGDEGGEFIFVRDLSSILTTAGVDTQTFELPVVSRRIAELRSTPVDNLTSRDELVKKYGFYERIVNPSGKGFTNDYEMQTIKVKKVIIDYASGLMWQQSGSNNNMDYSAAAAYISQLNREEFAGFSDWRLPTLEEALSLMEPALNNENLYLDPLFDKTQEWIWTSDQLPDSRGAWDVDFRDGDCSNLALFLKSYVRAVRSGQSSSTATTSRRIAEFRSTPLNDLEKVIGLVQSWGFFERSLNLSGKGFANNYEMQTVQGKKVIIDYASGLMWQQAGSGNNYMHYSKATDYIKQLNSESFAGYNDWRLPTLEEAMSLMEPVKNRNDLYIDPVFDNKSWRIWTSDMSDASVAWLVNFSGGVCYAGLVDFGGSAVKAVRSRQSSP